MLALVFLITFYLISVTCFFFLPINLPCRITPTLKHLYTLYQPCSFYHLHDLIPGLNSLNMEGNV